MMMTISAKQLGVLRWGSLLLPAVHRAPRVCHTSIPKQSKDSECFTMSLPLMNDSCDLLPTGVLSGACNLAVTPADCDGQPLLRLEQVHQ